MHRIPGGGHLVSDAMYAATERQSTPSVGGKGNAHRQTLNQHIQLALELLVLLAELLRRCVSFVSARPRSITPRPRPGAKRAERGVRLQSMIFSSSFFPLSWDLSCLGSSTALPLPLSAEVGTSLSCAILLGVSRLAVGGCRGRAREVSRLGKGADNDATDYWNVCVRKYMSARRWQLCGFRL